VDRRGEQAALDLPAARLGDRRVACRRRQTPAGAGVVVTTWYYADGTSSAIDIQMLCEGLASIAPPGLMIQFVPP